MMIEKKLPIVKISIASVVVLAALITFFSALEVIGTGKVGVVTQYGKVTGRELTEGASWIVPFAQGVTVYDTKVQKNEVGSLAGATKDLQDVNGTIVLNYQLNRGSVSKLHQTVGKDYEDKLVSPAIQEVFKASVAKYNASELVTNRQTVKKNISDGLSDRLKKYGINVNDVSITNFAFSAAFNRAIEQTQVASQEVAKARQEAERAKVDAEKKITQAQAQAESYRLQQQAITPELLQKQWIEKWDGKLPATLSGEGTVLYLPAGK
jgi:regulator of protease activity HflC (stomatin/prohibitin superfamily)